MSIFRLYSEINLTFEHNIVRNNFFLSACFCWISIVSLHEMRRKFKFGGTIGYENSYLELFFRHFKVFRLRAILHDAAGAVRVHSGEGPSYCYVIGPRSNSSLLGHVTGLLICLYVKLFLPSNFNSVQI